MPLPANGQVWPPEQLKTILPQLGVWSAWYSGSTEHLSAAYGGASDGSSNGFFASDQGGFRATVSRAITRFFWGESSRGTEQKTKLHIPIAAELCQASADLLFSDQMTLIMERDGGPTQARLDELSGDHMHSTFAEAAELAAALGGVFMKVTWDDASSDAPFLTNVDMDQAIPEFRWGRLVAVTFWQVVSRDGKKVFRHLERHELDAQGIGVVLHGLYLGDEQELGVQVSLSLLPATAGLAELGEKFGNGTTISSGSPGLCVFFVPNQTPNRIWRNDLLGKHYGRSDLDGIEQLMDALDEVYSSWMRDVRLGKARVMVAKSLLDNAGPGKGRTFDSEQEIYAPINSPMSKDQSLASQITQVQFAIRVDEHQKTAEQLVKNILQMAGYSMQTFGVGEDRSIRTATEIESKERRSLMTRERKLRYWRPAVADIIEKLMLVDKAIFGSNTNPVRPTVLFAANVQQTQLDLATTAQTLFLAQSASTEVRVALQHPDWDDVDVQREVRLIQLEAGVAVGDPTAPVGPEPVDTVVQNSHAESETDQMK
jgi:A118 family predicted phage portal protein